MPELSVRKLYEDRKDYFELTLLTSEKGLSHTIRNAELHRPGLALAGFFERFPFNRTQIFGETEMAYLTQKSAGELQATARALFSHNIPLVIIAKGLVPPESFLAEADRVGAPILSSRLSTADLMNRLTVHLDMLFAPKTSVHGTLVDVYGVGLLYTGKSGIGKSEIALDLVERGHRLVTDDVVQITRKAKDLIVGSGSDILGHHMEVRGIGIIDV